MKYILFIILYLLIIGCAQAENKELPSSTIIATNGCKIEIFRYSKHYRIYYFRHEIDINYGLLIKDIMDIEGIQSVTPKFYQVDIGISKSYAWEEVEPQILEILKAIDEYELEEIEEKKGGV